MALADEVADRRWIDESRTLRVFDDARDLALHDGNGRVGCAQIDTDDGALDLLLFIAGECGAEGARVDGSAAGSRGHARRELVMRSESAQTDTGACLLTVLDNLEDNIVYVWESLLKEMKATSEGMRKRRNGWVMMLYEGDGRAWTARKKVAKQGCSNLLRREAFR